MKTMKILFVAATTCAALLIADVASAQRLRDAIGSRLGARNAANATLQEDLAAEAATASAPQQAFGTTQTPTLPNQAAQSATANPAQQPAPIKKSDGSEFIIPANATPEELVAQAESLLENGMAFETEEEYNAWLAKMLATVTKISDQILKTPKLSDETFVDAISLKGQVLSYQASIDSANYLAKLGAYAEALTKNKRVQSLEDGRDAALAFKGIYLQSCVVAIAENEKATEKELTAAMGKVSAFIAQNPKTADLTVDLVYPVAVIAANLNDPKLPDKIWAPILKQIGAFEEPEAKIALQLLEGAIRRSQLEGAKFEWKGCDLQGKTFDAGLVEGHVVIVDFWNARTQACADVHTQLRQLYAKYHNEGLEIVGYSLDDKIADTKTYVEKNQIPWLILSDRATVDAEETSLAAYYGIEEIPTLILIGGDGKVAAVDISVESLAATLDSVFASAAQATASSASTATSGVSGAAQTSNATQTPSANAAQRTNAGATGAATPQTGASTTTRKSGAATTTPKATGAATPARNRAR